MTNKTIKALVWNEFVHEKKDEKVGAIYPEGIHGQIAKVLGDQADIEVTTATLDQPDHGITDELLAETDVVLWWGHLAHDKVDDAIVEKVVRQVWSGMGFIALHSGHFSKPFTRLMGTPCNLSWNEADKKERVWVVNPRHPIAKDIPQSFVIEENEMYGEPFGIPEPLETVMISWHQTGEVFRSGVTFRRGAGNVFYFSPGHETYPIYYDETIGKVLVNAVRWAYNDLPRIADPTDAPNVSPAEPV